jgi:hypothetical protein
MDEDLKERIEAEGKNIAKQLGNGVRYVGIQLLNDEFQSHWFNDDRVTNTSFLAKTFTEAQERLFEIRRQFKAPVPIFLP